MKFPNLILSDIEIKKNIKIEKKLINKLEDFFSHFYNFNPKIECSGSTKKGTALPSNFFGIDFDVTLKADLKILSLISNQSSHFEGCQLFSMDFFLKFKSYFENVYFAGHRLSADIDEYRFDFSITDIQKDKWKWDYHNSKIIKQSYSQINEIKKAKFFFKMINVYGSQLYGIVGPAIELSIYYFKNFYSIIEKVKTFNSLDILNINQFDTVQFPEEFFSLFEKSNDSIHVGLVNSFKYTVPNTYNRLIKFSKYNTLNIKEILNKDNQDDIYLLKTINIRLILYLFSIFYKNKKNIPIEFIPKNNQILVTSNGNIQQKKDLFNVCSTISEIVRKNELTYKSLPKELSTTLQEKLNGYELSDFIFFIGTINQPVDKNKTYIPIDILIRKDISKLIKIIKDC